MSDETEERARWLRETERRINAGMAKTERELVTMGIPRHTAQRDAVSRAMAEELARLDERYALKAHGAHRRTPPRYR